MTNKISIGIITHNSENDIAECIESLACLSDCVSMVDQIIVIDNGSQDKTLEKALSARIDTSIEIIRQKNTGFGHACNSVLDAARNDYVLILNPDVRLYSNTLDILQNNLIDPNHPERIVCVPQLEKNNVIQHSLRRFPTHTRTAIEAIVPGEILDRASLSEIIYSPLIYQYDHDVDWATGACWLMKKREVLELGGYKSEWFLYSEETELAYRISQAKKSIYYCHKAHVFHRAGQQHTNADLYSLAHINKLIFLYETTTRKPFLAWIGVVIGSFLRIHRPQARRCLAYFLKYRLRMYELRKHLIVELGGIVN